MNEKNHSLNHNLSLLDKVIMHVDLARKTLLVKPKTHVRDYPVSTKFASTKQDAQLSEQEKKHAASLMRVNHTGEVCAQALYQGQAITARSQDTVEKMQEAAHEELDHLAWCNQRLAELDSHASYLNFLWYMGALSIGITAGVIGDKWSLGFLAETEEQVVHHLESHLDKLPEQDINSREVIKQMRDDEAKHRDMALDNGAAELPGVIKKLMKFSSGIMTKISYRV